MTRKTFSEEFCGCSTQTPADSCAVLRRSSAGSKMNLTRIRVENGGNQIANFVRNNDAEGSRKTSQESFE